MRPIAFAALPALFLAAPAAAHPGHLSGLAGHDHWIAGAAIGAAIALGAWAALKGRRGAGQDASRGKADEQPAESEG